MLLYTSPGIVTWLPSEITRKPIITSPKRIAPCATILSGTFPTPCKTNRLRPTGGGDQSDLDEQHENDPEPHRV